MNKKIIVSEFMLLTIVLTGCSGQANFQNLENKESRTVSEQSETKEVSKVDKIEIFDFHSSRRCVSCLGMERNTRATLEEFFQPELRDGKITFDSINIEDTDSRSIELTKKYQATGSSLFINVIRNGEDNIEQDANAWRFATQDEVFKKYFKEKITNLLK